MNLPIEIEFDESHHVWHARVRAVAESIRDAAETEEDDAEGAYAKYRRELGANNILAETVPSAWGGNRERLDLRALCVAREELARVSGLADLLFVMQGLGSYALQRGGSDDLRDRWLPRVASGEAIAALGLTEEFAGSDVASLATTARREGEEYVLDGEKWFISNAGVADFYTVFATVDRELGRKGITCFLVEADREGLSIPRKMETLAPHPLGVVRMEKCRVPVANRLGDEGGGFALAMETLETFRTSVGAAALGMAERALDESIRFTKNRAQFGKPLADYQLTQAALAEMALDCEAARLLVYRAACARDRGASRPTVEVAMAKLFATEAAQRVVDRAVQLHGGRGVLRGSITERLYRDVRALRIYEGTSEIQKLVIASQLLRDAGAKP